MRRAPCKKRKELAGWLALESVIVTLTSALVFVLLHVWGTLYWVGTPRSSTLVFWGLVIMGAIVGITSTLFSRHFNHLVSGLTGGLKAVAEGDFSRRLDPKKGGPLEAAYEDFNKMSQELQSIQTLRDDFINNFSHEFKTPITAIKGFAELLREPETTPEEREQYLQIIIGESSRLAGLANSALLLTKLESHSWEKKESSFTASLEPAEYGGNEELMRHVWLNLLNNAVKYTPEGGEITVTLENRPGELAVTVADTGIGMSEEVRAHIFDKYYQGSASGSGGKGLGLGLSIVRRIVELCGGTIQVSSVEDQGSAFTVLLPRRV